MIRNLLLPLLLVMSAVSAGCNTMEGFGQDVERGGQKIQQEAR